jgi:hypothetical protein
MIVRRKNKIEGLRMRRKKEKKNNTPNQKVKNQIKGKKALK